MPVLPCHASEPYTLLDETLPSSALSCRLIVYKISYLHSIRLDLGPAHSKTRSQALERQRPGAIRHQPNPPPGNDLMFKNAIIYRIEAGWLAPSAQDLEDALGKNRFAECGPTQVDSMGWVEPRGQAHGPLLEVIGGQLVLKMRTQSRVLPGSVVKEEVDKRSKAIEEQLGHKPGKSQKNEIKEQVILEFLPRAFAKNSTTLVWLDPHGRFLVVGAGGTKKAEVVVTALVDALSSVGVLGQNIVLTQLLTQIAPGKAMSGWLHTQEAPRCFSVDRECELKGTDGEGATVRYTKHTLDIDEVVKHIEGGKEATKLAMTWEGRVSLVLAADLSLKKIELLDVAVKDGKGANDKGGDDFDADVAITTGELSKLIPDLIEALGGEHVLGISMAQTDASITVLDIHVGEHQGIAV